MSKIQTDHSFLGDKIKLRLEHLPKEKEINVLDCYRGEGVIWNEIAKMTDKRINVLGIDKDREKKGIYLIGDNLKFLQLINLEKYNIIDLDSYGVPFKQLEIIFNKMENKRAGKIKIFGTFIQSYYGRLPYKLLKYLGFSPAMIRKCPTLFFRDGWEKFKSYLYLRGVRSIHSRSKDYKHYFYFTL